MHHANKVLKVRKKKKNHCLSEEKLHSCSCPWGAVTERVRISGWNGHMNVPGDEAASAGEPAGTVHPSKNLSSVCIFIGGGKSIPVEIWLNVARQNSFSFLSFVGSKQVRET